MTPAHSSLGASSAKRWMTCPGSVALCAAVPPAPPSEAAREGTAAHWVAEQFLLQAAGRAHAVPAVGQLCPENDYLIDGDMIEHGRFAYVPYIRDIVGDAHVARVAVERKFDLAWVYPTMFGTCDASAVFDGETRALHIFDYKYGQALVSAVENPQLVFYALGAANSMLGPKWATRVEKVVLHVIQPRVSHIPDVWELDAHGLVLWVAKFRCSAALTEDPLAPRIYSRDGCYFCNGAQTDPDTGKPHCDVLYAKQLEIAERLAQPLPAMSALTPQQLADELDDFAHARKVADERYDSLRIWGLQQVDGFGIDVPRYKLAVKRAKRRWQNPDELIAILRYGHGLNDEQIYSSELRSPAQLEKLRDAEGNKIVAPDVVKQYTDKADNGVELVPVSDQRAAIAPRRIALPELPAGVQPFVQGE